MISMLIGIAGLFVSFIGWFAYRSVTMLIVGSALYGIETVLGLFFGELKFGSLWVDVGSFAIGAFIAKFTKYPMWIGGLLGLNFYSLVMTIIGTVSFVLVAFSKSKNK